MAAGAICIAVIALLSYRRLKKKKKPPPPIVDLEMPPIEDIMHNPQFDTASEMEETAFETASQLSSDGEDMIETANPMVK